MKKFVFVALAFIFTLAVFHACVEPLTEEFVDEELALKSANGVKSYIVVLNDVELNAELARQTGYEARQNAAKSAAERILKRAGITEGELGFVYGTALQGFSVKIPPGQLKKLQEDPSVKYLEEDQVVTLIQPDIKITGKPAPPTPAGQTTPWGITRVKGGGDNFTGTKKAWVIDTGIDLDHPDLAVNTSLSATFVTRTTTADDDNGHGSHCAGIIAAKNNTIGVIGVAPGATLVAVKVLDRRGSGTTSGVIAGVNYVADNAASGDVANMSLGGGISTTLDEAVLNASTYMGKTINFTLAAGNESDNANNHSPARINGPNIYTISAMAEGDVWASYSNYGNPPVDFCEPGSGIYSTYKGGGYTTMSGTSMAAPHAAGLLLLGSIRSGGTVTGDPDGNPDTIGVH